MKNGAGTFDLAEARRILAASRGKRFWSSLEEIVDQDGFRAWLEAEFPSAAAVLNEPARRDMLKLMASSLLLAGLAGFDDDPAQLFFQLAHVGVFGVGPRVYLNDRAMMRVRADKEDMVDAGLGLDGFFDGSLRLNKLVICGHYLQTTLRPFAENGVTCLNTGCGTIEGPVTALLYPEMTFLQV